MIINNSETEAIFITDGENRILYMIDDDQIVESNGFKVHLINNPSINDIDGKPYLILT